MKISEFKHKIQTDSSLVILDVRTPPELEGPLGKIDGVINIPLQELQNRINELGKFRNKEIAVICRTGRRSALAVDILKQNGLNAKNVAGGMVQFRSE